MFDLSYLTIIEFILGLFLWWIAIYLLAQNPISRIAQISFGILTAVSFYFSADLFLAAARNSAQTYMTAPIMRAFVWSMYIPIPLIYHASLTWTLPQKRKMWQKVVLFAGYITMGVMILLEAKTNLIRDYSILSSPGFSGDIADATGKHFWLAGLLILPLLTATTINFYLQMRTKPKLSPSWQKYFWPGLGFCLSFATGPFIILGYYNIIPYHGLFSLSSFMFIIIPVAYSIIRYGLFIEDSKIIFGKTFLYSTLVMVFVLFLYFWAILISKSDFSTVQGLIFPFILSYLIIASHPAYEWLLTFAHDLTYNISSGLSVVNDQEIHQSLKDYNHPEHLESSSLIRLDLVSKKMRAKIETPIDALQGIVHEAINHFKSESEPYRRTKRNLKYHLLKMLAFDEAEEGQILWELGFEDYPVRIMTKETKDRKPLFQIKSPSDYTATSRNAYLSLKKEAIHDVTWRISYLEKLSRKKLY